MDSEKNFAVVIPARYESSRFPGKPLVDICGKPMIQHVWERCCLSVGQAKVFVATDNECIQEVVQKFGGQVVMTSPACLTGTDRLAEANLQLNCDFIVNVQGDEPLISPRDINTVIDAFLRTGNVTNAMCPIISEQEFRSFTVPKVTFSQSGRLLYMSRSGIPLTKRGEYQFGYKQVCIYAFSKDQLEFFYRNNKKTCHEKVEDIEILRFLESDYLVDMVEVEVGSIAVDVPSDVAKVVSFMRSNR
jgi:3-deoxy-manno-octulosonate cytidylyltransferase (CMP-KDO synthetase)